MTWAAPTPLRPIRATVTVPGSKSATARALVLSALADGPGTIQGGLSARDSELMIAGLRTLGIRIDDSKPDRWQIAPFRPERVSGNIDCGLAGTVMRFLPPVAALTPGSVHFNGDPAASARPMSPMLDGLRKLGAIVAGDELPFWVSGPIRARDVTIDSSASSQFVSGLLLSAARFPEGLRLRHVGGPIPSAPHIDMTIAALAARGVAVRTGPDVWEVRPSRIAARRERIEPDLTTAAVFLAAALITTGMMTIPGWPATSTQPGLAAPDVLTAFGGTKAYGAEGLTLAGQGQLRGVDVDLHDNSELTPVVAALAALATTPSRIRGVAHIRGHETNRLAALRVELNALGGVCEETADGLIIRPRRLHPGVWHTYGDHRMAHAGALIGLMTPGIELDDIASTTKTMPTFARVWRDIIW